MALDRWIAAVAEAQKGLITYAQLVGHGATRAAIRRRVERGQLQVVHRRVYAAGHRALPSGGCALAAVLACGPGAYLSHDWAAAHWGLRPGPPSSPPDVTIVGRNPGQKPGIRVHRVTHLADLDVRVRDGIPVTSPARTVFDLASILPPREVERAFDEGRIQRLLTAKTLAAVIQRYPHRRGVVALQPLVDAHRPSTATRSDTEERFLALIRRAGLPPPELNARIGRYTIDAYWKEQGVAVELDGYRFHSTPAAFERDHAKDLFLRARRIDSLRFTRYQVTREPEAVLVSVAGALARGL